MAIKLITLNVEQSNHLDKFVPFLKEESPDIVCLQEVMKADVSFIKNELKMEGVFFPTSNKDGIEGTLLLTKLPCSPIQAQYYFGEGKVPVYTDPYSKERVLLYTTVENQGKKFVIGTTHFSWTPDGDADELQWRDFHSLMKILKTFDNLILCGDFNAPRGREMFTEFTKHFKDNLPPEIESTIDPDLHRAKGLSLAVDTIFSTPHYLVRDVKVVSGVSDHKAVVGYVECLE